MIGVYLGSCRARHLGYNLKYNDIDNRYHPDILDDMLNVDLSQFDYIVASPPCNYYSRANYRRDISSYSLNTKHLLPCILFKLGKLGKPFIVENVRNDKLFKLADIFKICEHYNIFVYYVGRHTYFTNIMINLNCPQVFDDVSNHSDSLTGNYRQGGINVYNVIEIWLNYINSC